MKKTLVFLLVLVLLLGLAVLPGCNNKNVIAAVTESPATSDSTAMPATQTSDNTLAPTQIERPTGSAENLTYQHGDLSRDYSLYLPAVLQNDAPLVFVLHGYTQTVMDAVSFGMNDVADTNGFAVCYPQGTPDESGNSHWNARFSISATDDIGFLSKLAAFVQTEYSLSANKTFSCGFSNGGFMSYTLACETDIFAAIASVGGTMSGETWETRSIAKPTPILQIHGTNDTAVPIDGSMSENGGWGGAPPLSDIIAFWAKLNGCTQSSTEFLPKNTNAFYYTNGINGNEVWFMQIDEMGHDWPTARDKTGTVASELIWEFFSKY